MHEIILAIEPAWNFSSVIEARRKSTKYKNAVFIDGVGVRKIPSVRMAKNKMQKNAL